MLFKDLQGMEIGALCALEITSIPDASILIEGTDTSTDVNKYIRQMRETFSRMLGELFFAFKEYFRSDLIMQDISAEFFWYAEPVSHQTYEATVRIFLVLRAIADSRSKAEMLLMGMRSVCTNVLEINRYASLEAEDVYQKFYAQAVNKQCVAILKEDRVENLQNMMLPQCYAYDKFPENEQDMSALLKMLLHSPGSAISFQLIPTTLMAEEISFFEVMSNNLDTVNKGIHEMSVGNLTNAVAERYARLYKYYEEQKFGALFHFNILIFGAFEELYKLTGGVNGFLNGSGLPGALQLQTYQINDLPPMVEYICSSPWFMNESIASLQYERAPLPPQASFDVRRLSNIVTADEAGGFFRLPIGGKNISGGIAINYAKQDNKNYRRNIIDGGDILVGTLKSSRNNQIGFRLKDINKHMLIVGTTGMGKTTFSVGLLDTLWKKHKLPFLVIEPAKTEYRALIDSIPDIQIFTPGKDEISPFVFNPFVPPKGVKLKIYKSVLKTAFAAGITMTTPLDKIFEEAVNNAYSKFGWLDSDTVDSGGDIFNIQDFAKEFEYTFDALGYVGEAKNIGRAGLVRLTSMINLFNSYHTVPTEDLLSKPTIIELAGVPNKEEKALIISLLLLNISAYIDSNYMGDGTLRNIILLEEAHNLLDSSDNNSEGSAKPNAIAQGLLKDMLAEKRSQGLGIIIADQSPEKVGADIIKQTNIKLSFNLVEKGDKEIFANGTNMADEQIARMTRLIEGEAFFFMNGMEEPEEVITPDYRADHQIRTTISEEEVARRSAYWSGKEEMLMPYPQCKYNRCCSGRCVIADRELAADIARKIFAMHFNEKTDDMDAVLAVLNRLIKESEKHLQGKRVLTKRLYWCIRTHLLRKIRYGTRLTLADAFIRKNLE